MNSIKNLLLIISLSLTFSRIIKFTVPENLSKAKITVKENAIFELKMDGNPTTGYSWFISNEDKLNDYGIEPLNIEGDYIPYDNSGFLMGSGGYFSFQFKAGSASSKSKVIKFVYKRFWEESEYDKHLTIYVNVKE
jgi:predicted secreted protein